jgi:hypothetical protein
MLYGVGRYLYDSEQVWVPYDETKDKYKKWTIEEYRKHCKSKKEITPHLELKPNLNQIVDESMTAARDYFEPLPDFDSLPKTKPGSIIEKATRELNKIGSYEITVGQWKGKTFDEVLELRGLGDLKAKYNFWAKDPKGDAMKKLVENLGMYLDAHGGK